MNYSAINELIGTRWVYRENDCWAVVRKASLAVFGVAIDEIEIPDKSNASENSRLFALYANCTDWVKVDKPTAGCVVFFRNIKGRPVHIGIYIEKGDVLHCPGSPKIEGSVLYENLNILKQRYKTIEYYEYNGRK